MFQQHTKHLWNKMTDKTNRIVHDAQIKIKRLESDFAWGEIQSAKEQLLALETLLEALEKEMVK